MAIKVNLSFKETSISDVILYKFLEEKSETIGKSAYIKTLLKEKLDQEEQDK